MWMWVLRSQFWFIKIHFVSSCDPSNIPHSRPNLILNIFSEFGHFTRYKICKRNVILRDNKPLKSVRGNILIYSKPSISNQKSEMTETASIDSFTKLFPLLPTLCRAPLPLLPGSSALLWEVIDAERGDLVPDTADRGELLPWGLFVLFGQRQSHEVILFEAGPLPGGVDLQTSHKLCKVQRKYSTRILFYWGPAKRDKKWD